MDSAKEAQGSDNFVSGNRNMGNHRGNGSHKTNPSNFGVVWSNQSLHRWIYRISLFHAGTKAGKVIE